MTSRTKRSGRKKRRERGRQKMKSGDKVSNHLLDHGIGLSTVPLSRHLGSQHPPFAVTSMFCLAFLPSSKAIVRAGDWASQLLP